MKPIKALSIIDKGIVVYVPSKEAFTKTKIDIYYSPKNPLFSYSYCEDSPSKIWSKKDNLFDKGTLFIYNTDKPLKKGFYKINLTMYDQSQTRLVEGSNTYAILKEKNTLYIGVPYSSFGPILLT
jgi:hypothetical protein